MRADSLKIGKVFANGGDVHYALPHFQREYTWEKSNWDTLLSDVLAIYDERPDELGEGEREPEHFLGSLVVINDGTRNGTVPAFKLVDGQQRLTTISLLLCALRDCVRESNLKLARKIEKLLVNADETEVVHFKLLPTVKHGDRATYTALLLGQQIPPSESRIPEAYEHLHKLLQAKLARDLDPEKLFVVLTGCLQVVFIDLNADESPFRIFESLNAKGKPLTQADLVRNYIAMRLPTSDQQTVFEGHWARIESLLQEKRLVGRLGEITAFLRHYGAMHSGVLCAEAHVYARFRDRMEKGFVSLPAFAGEIAALRRFAEYYDTFLRPKHESNPELRAALTHLNILEAGTAYPLLLAMYDAHGSGQLSTAELRDALGVIENYLMRRYLAGESTQYTAKMFPLLWRELSLDDFVPSLRCALAAKSYPNDHKVSNGLASKIFYDTRSQVRDKTCLILESIERHLWTGAGGYPVLDGKATVEHIMPQTLSDAWKAALGDEWQAIQNQHLHALGNLTLVTQGWNSALSNVPFAAKKQKLAEHALRLNSDYFSQPITSWGEEEIAARGRFLVDRILQIWPMFPEAHRAVPSVATLAPQRDDTIVLCGEALPVKSWRDISHQTAELLIRRGVDFEALATSLPSYFRRGPHPAPYETRCRELSNGWWIWVDLTGTATVDFCHAMLSAAGISTDELQLTKPAEKVPPAIANGDAPSEGSLTS